MKRLLLPVLLVLLASPILAQRNYKRPPGFNKTRNQALVFLEKQWWLGFRAGPTLSGAVVDASHQVITPTNYDPALISKRYRDYRDPGFQATFEVTFTFRDLSVSFLPTYRTNRFAYTNTYQWADPEFESHYLELHYEQISKLAYIDWPLLVRYEFPLSRVRPYVQAGIYSSLRVDATKTVNPSGLDRASGGDNAFQQEPIVAGANDLFAKNHWGLAGGGGVFYNLGNVRLSLEVLYKKGMSNIASPDSRYQNDRLTGVGDVPDDLRLNTISVTVGCLFPLRFLQSGFKSTPD